MISYKASIFYFVLVNWLRFSINDKEKQKCRMYSMDFHPICKRFIEQQCFELFMLVFLAQ